jgi:hypothetical protein
MARTMKAYRVLIHDLGSAEPVVLTAELASDRRAREFAHQRLASNPDYAAVEVWDGPVRLCRLSVDQDREAA